MIYTFIDRQTLLVSTHKSHCLVILDWIEILSDCAIYHSLLPSDLRVGWMDHTITPSWHIILCERIKLLLVGDALPSNLTNQHWCESQQSTLSKTTTLNKNKRGKCESKKYTASEPSKIYHRPIDRPIDPHILWLSDWPIILVHEHMCLVIRG